MDYLNYLSTDFHTPIIYRKKKIILCNDKLVIILNKFFHRWEVKKHESVTQQKIHFEESIQCTMEFLKWNLFVQLNWKMSYCYYLVLVLKENFYYWIACKKTTLQDSRFLFWYNFYIHVFWNADIDVFSLYAVLLELNIPKI